MIEVEVFPHRYLKAKTTEKFLNEIYSLDMASLYQRLYTSVLQGVLQ